MPDYDTMLSVEEFAALLIVGGFVNLRNNKQSGGYNVMTSDTDTWTPFLKDHKLFGCENVSDNVAEATKSKTKVEAFKRRKKGTKIGQKRKEVHTLRIGKDMEGESTIASKQLSDGIDPPNFHRVRKVRSAQQCLRSAVKPHIQHLLNDPEPEDGLKVKAVAEWVK